MTLDIFSNHSLQNLNSRAEFADSLGISEQTLIYLLFRIQPTKKYLTFEIPKKNGNARIISTPVGSLKVAQRKLSNLLYDNYVPYNETHGFVKDKSILTNAKVHKNSKWILNVDLKDFFGAINFGRVRGMFLKSPYNLNSEIATLVAQICCHDNKLPQGAPTSPILSNLICRKLDRELRKLARENNSEYTRYADDITFSSRAKFFPKKLAYVNHDVLNGEIISLGREINHSIKSNGFEVNLDKLRLSHYSQRLEVTGLTVNKQPNVRRSYVREIRAILHAWEKYGLDDAQKKYEEKYAIKIAHPKSCKPSLRNVVNGKLNFLRMIKGFDDPVYKKLRRQFETLDPKYKGIGAHNFKSRLYQSTWVVMSDTYEQGSGFWLKGYGFITCAHVLHGENFIVFNHTDAKGIKYKALIRNVDKLKDVAILEIENADPEFQLTRSINEIHQGQNVTITGFPSYDENNTKSINIVKATTVEKRLEQKTNNPLWRVNAQISSGNSGGPVLDEKFQVVGIVCRGSSGLASQTEDTVNGILPISQLDCLK